MPFDGATRWSNVRELQDKVRDAEDALERAKADAARADREARVRAAKDAIENAQGPVAFPIRAMKPTIPPNVIASQRIAVMISTACRSFG